MKTESMDKEFHEEMKQMMDQVVPSTSVKQRVWQGVMSSDAKEKRKKVFPAVRVAFAATCVFALAITGAAGANAATGGAFFQAVKEFCGLAEHQKEVAEETVALPNEVYAPQIFECSDDRMVVANERGLLVYDREQKKAVAALDLQALHCNYLNADTIVTRMFVQNDVLYLFNEKQDGKLGNEEQFQEDLDMAYSYDLKIAGTEEALSMTEDEKEISRLRALGKQYRTKHFFDTFDELQSDMLDLNDLAGRGEYTYSREGFRWKDETGKNWMSFLVVSKDKDYELYSTTGKNEEIIKESLMVETEEDNTSENDSQVVVDKKLPKFTYSGKDVVMAALCAEIVKDEVKYGMNPDGVFIPAPIVLDTVEDDDELVVFAVFQGYGYYRNGNTLECDCGGSDAVRVKLKKAVDGSYEITELLKARDGGDYGVDIKAFCDAYDKDSGIYSLDSEQHENIRKELIKMYVKDNQLDIQYYKDYGWDPVKIM